MRILKSIPDLEKFQIIDIKENPITLSQLEEMKVRAGSYEHLFSRRAKKYHQMGLKNEDLTEVDYKRLLLDEYTFLKRPVIIIGDKIFVGSSKKNIENLKYSIKKI